ncbi:lipid IV(A) 3-deoxy-D-manno-octulosonic acid transferase [Pseudoalteromonas sp. MMG012]|uniref:lipid IV(A) 3-deoxy-D-manno-octulosonic acid transferase n=1 Tax=Pseudoalteromonas sp. MMG012 TaxID=2822686 RepID=UPI001B3A300D|nr:lipid IV(A) 3-deoxy-D-manno-octulosonic acid transferase [Pseudoalteromonas sp. MMG012]MBQ4851652.1 lipid IV(A) 3-deoxy-D-manno-octulosonic acid transferase [Pseudoalteromonas sp. MMG012]
MIRLLYSCFLYILSPLIVIYLYLIRGHKNPAYRLFFLERFALSLKSLPKNAVIFHCASVGEVLAATPLIKAYIKRHPNDNIIITCNTPTGRQQATDSLGQYTNICYLPFDFWHCSKRFIKTLQPKLLIILETELWLNLLAQANKQTCPTVIINARLSEKSLKGYQRVSPLAKRLMKSIDHLACHNEEDANRFITLGLARQKVTVTGSIKFDIQIDSDVQLNANALKAQLADRLVWVAGSTHPKEHEKVLFAHQQLLKKNPNALLIIAPRHPEQFQFVENILNQQAFSFTKRSEALEPTKQVLLADTLGELKMLYGCADIAYIGGSLIERGGHNPLEAAAFAVGVLTGPSTYNFSHIYPDLLSNKGALQIDHEQQLSEVLIKLLDDFDTRTLLGKNAHACLQKNQGAIPKSLDLLSSLRTPEELT